MLVVWNGRRDHPGGRQLWAEEHAPRDPRSIRRERLPSAAPAPVGPSKFDRHAELQARVLRQLSIAPRTAREMAALLNMRADRVYILLYRMAHKGVIQQAGERPIPNQLSRRVERIYALPERAS